LIDGENLYPLHYTGMAITIVGIYIVNKTRWYIDLPMLHDTGFGGN
jgi:uncharacterized membrane protein YwaF